MRRIKKMWLKISIISGAVLILIVTVCSMLLLNYMKDKYVELAIEQTRTQLQDLAISFSEMAQENLKDETDPVVRQSIVRYCFSSLADETSVLIYGDKILHSSVIAPIWGSDYNIPLQKDSLDFIYYRLVVMGGRNIIICGGGVSIPRATYSVYVVKDITEVYDNITAMTWRFVIICAASVIIGTILISLLVRRAIKPLIMLKSMTRRMAEGEFGERVDIDTEDEVGELAYDFNAMARAVKSHIAKLEDTAQRQQLFIGGLTHEFKTPMTSMMIHTDTLLTADLTTEESRVSLKHLYEQCRWLERLSQKLLMLLTMEEKLEVHPVKVQELFADVYESTAEILQTRNTPLVIECDIDALKFDYDLMKSMLINLIDNASKASESGQLIKLRAYSVDAKYRGVFHTIEVSDCGRGIPKDEIDRITDAFYMVDRSRSKKMGGSGLGLALVKRIAEAHHAKLVIESELSVGTTVKVIFKDEARV